MIESYWATNGITVWFRFNGKVYSRKIIGLSRGGLPKVRFEGNTWYMMDVFRRDNIEDVINLNRDLRYIS